SAAECARGGANETRTSRGQRCRGSGGISSRIADHKLCARRRAERGYGCRAGPDALAAGPEPLTAAPYPLTAAPDPLTAAPDPLAAIPYNWLAAVGVEQLEL